MPLHKEQDAWKGKASDIAYKEPFTDATNKTRKQLVFWSGITLLNHFFPIDLTTSHVLGFKFSDGVAPPFDFLLALIVIYLTIVLAVYVFQELSSWLAQANEVELAGYVRSLHDIYAHHGSIDNAVKGAVTQLLNHKDAVTDLAQIIKEDAQISNNDIESKINQIDVHKQSFDNFCSNLSDSNVKFGEEIEQAKAKLEKVSSHYRGALISQLIKVLGLEVLLPFSMGGASIYFFVSTL